MSFGALIIGDEILSGRRSDKHLARLIELLRARGLKLGWARYAGDEPGQLVGTLKQTFASGDIVFSFGGIGATPDDHTRQSAATALGCELALHPDAEAEIRARFGAELTPARLQMGVFPVGSEIIPNPYNRIPGFSIRNHHFVPGFPVMAWPMVEWVLDNRYRELHHAEDYVEQSVTVWDAYEGQLIELMRELTAAFPDTTLFSLPTIAAEGQRRCIELGMKGTSARVIEAMTMLKAGVTQCGFAWEDRS
ncbi:competence/damage-inducible protein A [Azoarcus sp. L1K30]|uniref:competence/damage-inducible protein A n=1 Tax=Azoarcus sp. L1K30 TaxID=2820277 RepID=UPI001B818CDC|nr:molybdopterin-binding protein [Azoarcus sp. L1K30]MBR0568416.1 competence/damage-inducible protein A [Azoarcus sp. L1K30]